MTDSANQNESNDQSDGDNELSDKYGQLKDPANARPMQPSLSDDVKKYVRSDRTSEKVSDLPPKFVPPAKPVPPEPVIAPPVVKGTDSRPLRERVRAMPWVALAAVVGVILLIFGIGLLPRIFSGTAASATAVASPAPTIQPAIAPTVSAGAATAAPIDGTAVPTDGAAAPTADAAAPTSAPTATVEPTTMPLDALYLAAVQAKKDQNWEQATTLFNQIYGRDTNYLDTKTLLAEASLQLGKQQMSQGQLDQALGNLKLSAGLTEAGEASELVKRLELYQAGHAALDQKDWPAAIDNITKLRAIQPDFIDSVELLYQAYMGSSESFKQQNQQSNALQACKEALALKADDQAARSCVTTLTPVGFSARMYDNPNDAAAQCGSSFDSKIWGVVRDVQGRGVRGATVQVRASDGRYKQTRSTNSQGGFEVPGLGCTKWVVTLVGVPDSIAPAGIRTSSFQVDLNGGRYSGAGIEFKQR